MTPTSNMPSEEQQAKRPADIESLEQPTAKQPKTTQVAENAVGNSNGSKGIAPIKAEYIISTSIQTTYNDDEAESSTSKTTDDRDSNGGGKKGKKNRGQNKKRELKQVHETVRLCPSLIDPENSEGLCKFGAEACRFSHDVEGYLVSKPADIDGLCPVFEELGYCPAGIKCRWLGSHFDPKTKRLIKKEVSDGEKYDAHANEINWISVDCKNLLQRRKFPLERSDLVFKAIDSTVLKNDEVKTLSSDEKLTTLEKKKLNQLEYNDTVIKPGEKKKLNLKGKKIVSPLTTVGNLPFRRLMKTLGADVTYSEMAFGLPLIQGSNSEWALPKAHKSEYPGFGVQLATAKHWQACKVADILSQVTSTVSELNLNCGCPIDLLFRKGEGSALMESGSKLIRILKGMNYSSGDIPVTVKLRMGVKDDKPLAESLVPRLLKEGDVAAVTLHGRSRQQRYTKEANWEYIGKIGKIVKDFNEDELENKDNVDKEPVYLIGNGDVFNYEDYNNAMSFEGVDGVMVARGALIKPWIFEEIESQQHLDKSASERLSILETYSKFALNHWGSDEFGLNSARRFMCEFISFTHRYIPTGLLERLPSKLNQRPPKFRGRSDLETLLASDDYKDWIKITEMFLGKASDNFSFIPKHKSNSYETPRE